MSRYTIYYDIQQDKYREFAIRWSKWAQSASLTETEQTGVELFFRAIARRFGLITEFRELGIIN